VKKNTPTLVSLNVGVFILAAPLEMSRKKLSGKSSQQEVFRKELSDGSSQKEVTEDAFTEAVRERA
jgi:hypothetical protein